MSTQNNFILCNEMGQSCEEEVLVWVFPNHESKRSDLEKPILALPIHRIDIPEKLKKWHQEVENYWHQEVEIDNVLVMEYRNPLLTHCKV